MHFDHIDFKIAFSGGKKNKRTIRVSKVEDNPSSVGIF